MTSVKKLMLASAITVISSGAAATSCWQATGVNNSQTMATLNIEEISCLENIDNADWVKAYSQDHEDRDVYVAVKPEHFIWGEVSTYVIENTAGKPEIAIYIGSQPMEKLPGNVDKINSTKGVFWGDKDNNGYHGVAYTTVLGNLVVINSEGEINYIETNNDLVPQSLVSTGKSVLLATNQLNQVVEIKKTAADITERVIYSAGTTESRTLTVSNDGNFAYKMDLGGNLKVANLNSEGVVVAEFESVSTSETFETYSIISSEKGAIVKSQQGPSSKLHHLIGDQLMAFQNQTSVPTSQFHSITQAGIVNNKEIVNALDFDMNMYSCVLETLQCSLQNHWGGDIAYDSLVSADNRVYGLFADVTPKGQTFGRVFNTYHAGGDYIGFAPLNSEGESSLNGSLAVGYHSLFSVSSTGVVLHHKWSPSGWYQTPHTPITDLNPYSLVVDGNNRIYGQSYDGDLFTYQP